MTDRRRATDQPTFLTAEELAARTGTSVDRIEFLTERGVLKPQSPGHYTPGDVHRIRVIGAFEAAGITIDALVAAAQHGRVSFAYYDELHQVPGPASDRTYTEFKASLGLHGERLSSLFVAFGLAEPDPASRLEAAEEGFLGELVETIDGTAEPDVALRVARLFGEGARRASEASLGLYEDVLAKLGREVAVASIPPEEEYRLVFRPWARMARMVPEMSSYLASRHLSRAIDIFSAEQTERILAEAGFVPERREVYPGVAFVDLTGFTRLSEERGDRAAAALSMELGELARETATHHDGRVVKLLGDGVLLRLPDALRAVDATIELMRSLPRVGLPDGHAGIHAGPVIEREGDVFGRSVNMAARISDVAPPGELYVTEAVVDAIQGSSYRAEALAPAVLQGIGEVPLFRIAVAGG
jgi:adenylate cyclase